MNELRSNDNVYPNEQNKPPEKALNGISEEYEFEFDFDIVYDAHERWGEQWDVIEINDCIRNFIPWVPQVPIKDLILRTEYEIIEVKVTFYNAIDLDSINLQPAPELDYLIAPQNAEDYTGVENQSLEDNYDTDLNEHAVQQRIEEYFSYNYYYPEHDYLITKIDQNNVNNVIQNRYSFQLFPCKYNPCLKAARLYQNAHVRINYTTPAINKITHFESAKTCTRARAVEDIGQEIKYLILTTSPLMDELEPLAAWKIRKGITTKIVDVSTIYQNESFTGYDEPEEIRSFVRYAYNNLGTEYVLLAGDYDTVPPRMCEDPDPYPGADDGEIPSDSYYACITGESTWDVDEDHIYGELGDLDDIYPDVAVGRIAINSEIKMASWVAEVINYECNPGIKEWCGKVILIGPNVHNEGDGAEQSEYYYDNYLKYVYDTYDKFYESSDAGNKQFSKSEIVKSINNGCTFINYLGHGGPTSWTYNYGYSGLLNKGDVNGFENGGMKPVVYAMSCLTEWFDDPSDSGYGNFGDCIGETFTENIDDAGIGYIGSARTSVGTIGNGYQPFATGLQEDFIRQLSQYNLILGDTFTDGKKHYSDSFGTYFTDTHTSGEVQACWLEVNLLGEPTLPLWNAIPRQFNVTNNSQEDSIIITVKNETDQPVLDASVCIQSSSPTGELEVFKVKHTSSTGEVIFDIANLPINVNLTVSKINFIPYLEKITIKDMIPPETQLEITPANPDGENEWYVTIPYINFTTDEEAITYFYWDRDNTSGDGFESEAAEIYFEPIHVSEGEHVLYYYSIDPANNIEPTRQFYVNVDVTAPLCNLKLDPVEPDGMHGWYIQQPTINITSEPEAVVYYAFDDDLNLTFLESIVAPIGIHDLSFYSRDHSGNVGETVTVTIKVDTTPPITNLTLEPESPNGLDNWYIIPPTIFLETEENAKTYYYWDSTGENISYLYTEPIICREGVLNFHYYSIDYAGCPEKVRNVIIKLDTVSPLTTHLLTPETPDGQNGFYISKVQITLRSEQNATIHYCWDNGSALVYKNPIQGLEGVHTLCYYSIDTARNIGEKASYELRIDTTKPEIEIMVTPEEPSGDYDWYNVYPSVEFETESQAVVYYHFEYGPDSIALETVTIPEGMSTIYYHSVDLAGNIGSEHWKAFKVDRTPPKAKLETDMFTFEVNDMITFDFTKSMDNFEVKGYFIDFGDGSTSGWVSTPEVKHRYLKPGDYDVRLKARDEAGIESINEAEITILILEEDTESTFFTTHNLFLIITIIAFIFIVLSFLFIIVHRSYRQSVIEPTGLSTPGNLMGRAAPRIEPASQLTEEFISSEPEPADAIILDKATASNLKKLKCVGCGTSFIGDLQADIIKCPGCGLPGKLNIKNESKMDSQFKKFKCPSCETVFKTTLIHGRVKCPQCGISGEI